MHAFSGNVRFANDGQYEQAAGQTASFGPFQLRLPERLLMRGNEPVAVGDRALDILSTLITRAGEVVTKHDLFKSVWPDTVVEDAALRVQIANLRRMIGDGRDGARYIASVTGRGYCFVGPVRRSWIENHGAPARPETIRPANLPTRLPCIVGRDEAVATVVSLLEAHRFVSVVGPGGMGKTTVALAAAHGAAAYFDGAVYFVDLSALTDASLVLPTIASAIGCIIPTSNPTSALIAFLLDKRMCLVLDSCEHLVEEVATIAERLFEEAPHVSLMATTREALRVKGEYVYSLPALEGPPEVDGISAAEVLASPAGGLFMRRAAASGYNVELTDAEAPIVASVCRRLDGVPLAIEIAGCRVGAYGVRGIAELLDNRFELLWQGQRSSIARHRTLQATLDWSYNLLSDIEQRALRNLAVFVGSFTLEAARSVALGSDDGTFGAIHAISNLVDKSLISISTIGGLTYYRLLDTTRAYVLATQAENTGSEHVKRRHAVYYKDNLARPERDREAESAMSMYIGNVRAGLEWSFSPGGDAGIGVELSALAAPLFLRSSLLGECEHWCERGLAALCDSYRGTPQELALLKALAISSMFTSGNTPRVHATIERGLEVAEILNDVEYKLHFLSGLNLFLTRRGDFVGALRAAQWNSGVASEFGPAAVVRAEWMLGATHHMLGNQAAARDHCERGFKLAATSTSANVNFFGYDHHVRARVALARNLWLRGFPDQAVRTAYQAIDEGAMCDHPATLCISLLYATYVFFWCGDFHAAERLLERALALTLKHSLRAYHAVGSAMKGELLVLRGAYSEGLDLLQTAVPTLLADDHHVVAAAALRAQAEGLAICGRAIEGRAIMARALARAEQLGGTFDMPDLMRAHGQILLVAPECNVAAAEQTLIDSIDLARQQAALGWELRSSIALARLWAEHDCIQRANEMLSEVHGRFTEGFESSDLRIARQLLATFDHSGE
jgi:predicted ATPase/DNA-binding winged helix-turn-helix (wHTH) protein